MEVWAVHPQLDLLAVAPANEIALFSSLALRRVQRFPEAGCKRLAWHHEGPTLAAYLVRSCSASVLLFTNSGAAGPDSGLVLRCAHRIQLPDAEPGSSSLPGSAGLTFAAGHLLLAGAELAVWGCSFTSGNVDGGAHFLHCAEDPQLRHPLASLGPVVLMELDGSQRFLATLHRSGGTQSANGNALRVWSVFEGSAASAAGNASASDRRRSRLGGRSGALRNMESNGLSSPVPCMGAMQEVASIDGVSNVALQHDMPISGFHWCPARDTDQPQWCPAVLAVVDVTGAVTIWRENASSEPLTFLAEAFWQAQDLWSGTAAKVQLPATGCALEATLRWAAPRRDVAVRQSALGGSGSAEDEFPVLAGLPLRVHGHGSGSGVLNAVFSKAETSPSTLVALRKDGFVAVLHLDTRSARCPLNVRRVLLPVSVPVQGGLRGAEILHAAVVAGEIGDSALEVWLALGSDMCRARLEQNESATVLAVSGGHAEASQADGDASSETESAPARANHVAVHCLLGLVACHVREALGQASVVWIFDVPSGQASPNGGRYDVSVGAWRRGSHGSMRYEAGLEALCWAPGRAVPPLLLAVGAGSRKLLSCVVDPVRGVVGTGTWNDVLCKGGSESICNVQQIQVLCEEDEERAMICLLCAEHGDSSRFQVVLGCLEVPVSSGAPTLHALYKHEPFLEGLSGCCAVEWLSCLGPFCGARGQSGAGQVAEMAAHLVDTPKAGDLVGQLAVSMADSAQDSDILVHTLQVESAGASAADGSTTSEWTLCASGLPFRASMAVAGSSRGTAGSGSSAGSVAALSLAVSGEWLMALTSLSQVLVWCLTPMHGSKTQNACVLVEPSSCFPVSSRLQNRGSDVSRFKSSLRPYITGPVTHQASQSSLSRSGTSAWGARESSVSLTRGSLMLHRFASGGLGLLVTGCSDTNVAVPMAVICTRSASDGEVWRTIDLHVDALPIASEAISWMSDGRILHAGNAAEKFSPMSIVASKLPEEALGWLNFSTPCPSYHPETLVCLVRSGQTELCKSILTSLLRTLQGPRAMGISPLLDLPFSEFLVQEEVQEKKAAQPAAPTAVKAADSAADLFGDGDINARFSRFDFSAGVFSSDMAAQGFGAASSQKAGSEATEWRLSSAETRQLSELLQSTSLPLVAAGEQTQLLSLLEDQDVVPRAADVDECARRFMQALALRTSVQRKAVTSSGPGEPVPIGQHLSSEDMCWALHSSCQSTIVDSILQTLGSDLDWPALRGVGLGLWLTDAATLKKVIEALPRSILKKQGKDDFQPESMALWYAMLGKRTLLGALYKQQKQMRICEFLANDLAKEPWCTKAKKNAFELVRQRRYELACAFFIFARNARDAIDVCVRYLDDWALALLIAQHLRAERGDEEAELTAEVRRVLSRSLLPLARRARDPWLASLGYWRIGDHARALECVTPPYRLRLARPPAPEHDGAEAEEEPSMEEEEPAALAESLLSGGTVRHGGTSPGLPRFFEVLREVMAKRRMTADDKSVVQDAEASATYGGASAVVSKAYLVRRQPLLALPQPSASSQLPWRIAVGVARAMVSLFCASGQPLVRHDGSVALSELAAELTSRLSLPAAVIRATLSEVNCQVLRQECSTEPAMLFANVTPFYSPSFALPPLPSSDSGEGSALGMESILMQLPPYLRSYMGNESAWAGTPELKEEFSVCRVLRCLSFTHASRALSVDERSTRILVLSALVWRTMLRFREYLQDAGNAPLPAPTMHLAAHLICALCVSRPPAPVSLVGAAPPAPSDLPGDLAHIVTALVVTLTLVLSLSSLTPKSGLWALRSESAEAEGPQQAGNRSSASEAFNLFLRETEDKDFEKYAVADEEVPDQPEVKAPPWEPTFWQGLRVLLEHLEGSTAEQRRLHRSGVLPSLIVSLFLRPAFIGESSNPDPAHVPTPGASEELSGATAPTGATSTNSGSGASPPPRPSSNPSLHGSSESEDETGSGAAHVHPDEVLRQFIAQLARDTGADRRFKMLLQTVLVELAVERLVALLSGIRKRQPGSAGHWITAWYEALLSSLRTFLRSHISERVLRIAAAVSAGHEKLAVVLCASESALSEAFGSLVGGASSSSSSPRGAAGSGGDGSAAGSGAAFLALWRQLNGTRRLQILFSHHPALGFSASQLQRRSAVLWKYGSGVPIRFVCADLASPLRLAVHARSNTVELHAAHAARWFATKGREMQETDASMHSFDSQVERYVQGSLATAVAAGSGAPEFDAAAEMLLGSASHGRTVGAPPAFAGTEADVAHFFATLQHAGGREGSFSVGGSAPAGVGLAPRPRGNLICAEAHPSRPLYAVACEDSSVHLWAFGEPGPRCALPSTWRGSAQQRPAEGDPRRRAMAGAPSVANATAAAAAAAPSNDIAALAMLAPVAEPAEAGAAAQGREQRKCTLAWNNVGDRLLGVGSLTAVTLWTVGEGRGACQANAVPTGAAHSSVTCGTFVSPGSVVATAGRRADWDGTSSASRAWPQTAAGLCIWDTLAPPGRALVAHDGPADAAAHQMPADYACLTWAAEQRSILCGTKSGELRVFDLRQQRISHRISAHEGSIRYVFLLPRTQRFVTLSSAAEMKVWSLRSFDCLETRSRLHSLRGVGSVLGKTQALTCATLLSENHLVTGGQDGVVLLTRL